MLEVAVATPVLGAALRARYSSFEQFLPSGDVFGAGLVVADHADHDLVAVGVVRRAEAPHEPEWINGLMD